MVSAASAASRAWAVSNAGRGSDEPCDTIPHLFRSSQMPCTAVLNPTESLI